MTFTIEALARHHERSRFRCGSDPLDRYLRRQASQDARRNVSRVFVAIPDALEEVAGFYTLSAGSVERETLPESAMKRLPRYPVPVALLGRLGVDRRFSGQGLGSALLLDALRRVLHATRSPSTPSWSTPRTSARRSSTNTSVSLRYRVLPGGSSCPSARSSVSSSTEQPRVLRKPGVDRTCPTAKRWATAPPPRSGTSAHGRRPGAFPTSGTQGAGLRKAVRWKVAFPYGK